MTEPQIQYALTEDGVSIAYWTLGEGRPFILPHGAVVTSSLRAWRTPEGRVLLERLSAQRMIVRYDARGFGNSQAGTADFTLQARVRDLSAVIDRLGAEQVAICGYLDSGPGVLAYAAANPDRVSHLVLWATSARGLQFVRPEVLTVLAELAKVDFELYTEAMASAVMRALGIGRGADEYAETLREGMTPSGARSFLQAQRIDVTDVLDKVQAPTLVLHRRGIKDPPMGEVQALAARIPNARLVFIEGESSAPYVGDIEPVVAALDEFLGDGPGHVRRSALGGLVTILFTDLVGHAEMMQRLGDDKGREVLREHERITRETLRKHGGSEVKTMGDGFMASFGSAISAVDCAIELQKAFEAWNERDADGTTRLDVRVGLDAGEPINEDGDLFGSTVILASRIAGQADAGEILIAEPLRHLLTGKSYVYAERGNVMLKGFEDAVRLYEVRWRD